MKRRDAASDWIVEALALRLTTNEATTLVQQLYCSLKEWIQHGELTAGDALPSSRYLARALGISRNTVLATMDRLLAEGLLIAHQGAGLYVANLPALLTRAELPPPLPVRYSSRGNKLLTLSGTLSHGHRAFSPGVPALDLFPREQWQRLLRRHYYHAEMAWMDYQTSGGLPALKAALCDYLRLSRAVRCQPEQIVITQGAQQAFELIAQLLTDPGDSVWMEEPGYGGAQACFLASGLTVTPVPVDKEGLNPLLAPENASTPRLIYVTPSHQYPSGVTMPVPRRLALLEHASRAGSWIIEDDYDSEFRYDTPPTPSLQGLAEQASVIYVGTFSKVLYPGLRLGYLVLPDTLAHDVRRAHARLHREGNYPVQSALAEFITSGHFTRHIARMRAAYRQRQACLRTALAPAVAAGLRLSDGHAGMHLLAELDTIEEERMLVKHASEAGITLSPLSRYYLSENKRPGLVLGYAGSTESELLAAGAWLSDTWLSLSHSHLGLDN
ncbi:MULTISPECIES: PLP-dependent aminotransferase family protein [unclassified Halomonas]|uniref:MocR-like pyridoxine biosynthesis transcription factor PdxR n=1 Tax=unclassified Halomonas TaxID=2609666 RepID=UPI001CF3FBAE|nr:MULTISPECIES: PLP-dependent aminotransferase family protein [unclassified Halomonas]MCA8863080.1 PLP-dependent aminotransferase family protein [Halomonas sp. SBBP1]UZH09416.1 PLP-dependent aminotransferase family protein [Halomonas sp. BDJS001]